MKKVVFTFMFVAMSVMTYAQLWTSLGKSTPAGPEVTLVSSSEKQIVVDFTIGGFSLTRVETPNGAQNIVSVPEMATMLEAGAPDLPQYPVSAIIGDMAEMQVSVRKSDFTDYENVEIAPSKGNFSRQIDPATVPYTYGEMYSQNAFYPAVQATLDAPYILRDFRGQNIMVRPFAYNPVTKTLRVYHHMTIEMRKVSDNGENQKVASKATYKVSPEAKAAYGRRFINYKENEAKYPFVEDRGEMLVICADQFMAKMQSFVDWKNQSGRPTTMVSVTEVGGNNDTQIKNYITNLYNDPAHNLVYVLFVGDYQHITPHALSGERSDNWFGQVEGTDRYPEVFVGRFSVEDDMMVENQVNKVIYYERDMPEGLTWADKGLGIGQYGAGSGHYGEDDYQHIDFIRDTLQNYTYSTVTDLHGNGGGATASAISNVINQGVSIINYCNHGSEDGWAVANYSNSHVNALTNDNRWPIVWSVACLCGKFNYGTQCFAEAWMRATNNSTGVPTGAIGGMFSWMSQPWVPPMYGQDEMVNILTEWHGADQYNHTLSGASLNGNMDVLDKAGSAGYTTHDTWVLFGDPSLMVRTANPVSMNVSCTPPMLMLGMTDLQVTAENTAYGIATLMMDNEVIASGNIQNGVCNLHFNPMNNVGIATLTVMGFNKVTEIIDIPVNPAAGPFVTVNSYGPSFAPVNQVTSLSMSFKNVGADPTAGPTNVTLSCASEGLNLVNSTAQFGVLGVEETVTLENAFSFILSENVEDGFRFQIDVTMECGGETWHGKTFVTARKAVLEYVSAQWDGSFVPGETLSLYASFQNAGQYMATNAVATIACESEYVTLLNPAVEIGTIDPEGVATCPFQIAIDENCPQTEQIPVHFTLQADGGLMVVGTMVLKNSCVVLFELSDSFGDGWNGSKLVVSFNDGTPDVELSVSSPSTGYPYTPQNETQTLEIGNGVHVTLSWVNGQFSYECSFVVKYEDGTIIYQSSNLSAGVLHEFDCNCASTGTPMNFPPVENLAINVEEPAITLTWAPQEGAIRYIIMRNGIEVAQVRDTYYTEETDQTIYYNYCVIAQYAEGVSVPECVIADLTDIEEHSSAFSLYPNPANSILYVNGGDNEFTYEMYNGMGQKVAGGQAQGIEQINVESLTKGIYFLRLTNGSQVHVEKVVVK